MSGIKSQTPFDYTTAIAAGYYILKSAVSPSFASFLPKLEQDLDSLQQAETGVKQTSGQAIPSEYSALATAATAAQVFHNDLGTLANFAASDLKTSPSTGQYEIAALGALIAQQQQPVSVLKALPDAVGPVLQGPFDNFAVALTRPVTSDDGTVSLQPSGNSGTVLIGAGGGGEPPPNYPNLLANAHADTPLTTDSATADNGTSGGGSSHIYDFSSALSSSPYITPGYQSGVPIVQQALSPSFASQLSQANTDLGSYYVALSQTLTDASHGDGTAQVGTDLSLAATAAQVYHNDLQQLATVAANDLQSSSGSGNYEVAVLGGLIADPVQTLPAVSDVLHQYGPALQSQYDDLAVALTRPVASADGTLTLTPSGNAGAVAIDAGGSANTQPDYAAILANPSLTVPGEEPSISSIPNVTLVDLRQTAGDAPVAGFSLDYNSANQQAGTDWRAYESALNTVRDDTQTSSGVLASHVATLQDAATAYHADLDHLADVASADALGSNSAGAEITDVASQAAQFVDTTNQGVQGLYGTPGLDGVFSTVSAEVASSNRSVFIRDAGNQTAGVGGACLSLPRVQLTAVSVASGRPDLRDPTVQPGLPTRLLGTGAHYASVPNPTMFDPDNANFGLPSSSASYTDVSQGALRDCWFLAALQNVAYRHPSIIQQNIQVVSTATGTHYDVTFNADAINEALKQNHQPELPGDLSGTVTVSVDGQIPVGPSGNTQFAEGTEALWPAIYEKAAAKLFGGYDALERGFANVGYALVTGQNAVTNFVNLRHWNNPSIVATQVAAALSQQSNSQIVTAVFAATGSSPTYGDLVPDHMYTVFGTTTNSSGQQYVIVTEPQGSLLEDIPIADFKDNFDYLETT